MDFGIDNAIYTSFKILRKNLSKVLSFFILVGIVYIANGIIFSKIDGGLAQLESWIFGVFVEIATITFVINILKKRKTKIQTRLTDLNLFIRLLVGNIVSTLIIIFGFLALIIPGIVFAVRLGFVKYLVIEKGMGPIEAVKASWKLTEDRFFYLLGLGVVLLLINLLGLLLLVVGLIITIPLTSIIYAWVYLKLSEK